MARKLSKKYLREQRRDMIRIFERSRAHWLAESARYHRLADEMYAILAGHYGAAIRSARDMVDAFQKWADKADANLRNDERKIKRWKAKKI